MRLWRAHGLGNVYLVLEAGPSLDPSLVRALCDRATGVGADGILEPVAPVRADHGVRIWNPDGSVAEKSGNGLRIFARWLADRGAGRRFSVWTGHGVVSCEVGDGSIRVAMGRARVPWTGRVLDPPAPQHPVTAVDVGNPHCVAFVEDVDAVPWRDWGRALETHPAFPARTNVQVASVGAGEVRLRIWERGAGATPASGSSACAVVVAAVATGRGAPGRYVARAPGGDLVVAVSPALDVSLEGPVEGVGTVDVAPAWIAARR